MRHTPSHTLSKALAVVLLFAATTFAGNAQASPAPIPIGAKLVYNFNVIGYPAGRTYDGNCGDGHRIFVNREASKAQVLVKNGANWSVVDCNATSDHQAVLQTNQVGLFNVYMRILGKPGGHFFACGQTVTDFATGDTLCLLGTIDLTRASGQSKFQLAPSAMFDASLEDLIWTVDTNADFRIVQFRVYQVQ
ncbi:MAG TPA: hypothetical protein VI504_16480 [Candidatus Eisenbacteria bacterium]|jgi:hypothetical protein